MKKAKIEDQALVIEILAHSFDENPSVNYIIRQDKKREERIRALMAYSFDVCQMFGEVWLSENRMACALVLYPDKKKTTLKTVWLDIKLVLKAVGISGVSKTLRREAQIKEKQHNIPMAYLWF